VGKKIQAAEAESVSVAPAIYFAYFGFRSQLREQQIRGLPCAKTVLRLRPLRGGMTTGNRGNACK
jgi:hypothetical protein